MPKKMHDALEREAKKKAMKGKAKDRHVYGGMANAEKRKGQRRKT